MKYHNRLLSIGIMSLALIIPLKSECHTLKYAESMMPQTLNPLNPNENAISLRLSSLIFTRLTGLNREKQMEYKLLSPNPIVTQGSTTYTFNIKRNVCWDDNTPFTAYDIEFTFRMLRHQETQSDLKWVNNYFKSVTALDNNRIQFILTRPMRKESLMYCLEVPILPKHQLSTRTHIPSNDSFGITIGIGNGPFRFSPWQIGGPISLNRNNRCLWEKVTFSQSQESIDSIEMSVFEDKSEMVTNLITKNIDLIPCTRPQDWQRIRNSQATYLSSPWRLGSFVYFAFNMGPQNTFFTRNVRKALTMATNRIQMFKVVYGEQAGTGTEYMMSGPFLPGKGNLELKPLPYDTQQAKNLLQGEGFRDLDNDGILERERDGREFSVSLKSFSREPEFRKICELLKMYLREVGIKIDIMYLDYNDWYSQVVREHSFDIAFGNWNFAPGVDIVSRLFKKDAEYNIGGYRNSEVDKMINLKEMSKDPDEILSYEKNLHGKLLEDCPYIFLFTIPTYAGCNNRLNIQDIHPYYFFPFINYWYWRR